MPARVPTFIGSVGAFRSPGVAVVDSTLLAIFNQTGSGVLVAVRRLTIQVDQAGASGTLRSVKTTRLTTAPTTGTLLDPQAWDTSQSHNANVEIRGRASADGTNGTLTATPGADRATTVFGSKDPTAVDQMLMPDADLLPDYPYPEDPLVLREGEGILVSVIESGSSAANYLVNAMIEEFTYAAGGATVTPGVATLTTDTFAPTVTATAHQTVTPATASLTLATFAPTATGGSGTTVVPGVASLALASFIPTVSTSDHKLVTPATASLTTARFAPTVTASLHQRVTPGVAALSLAAFAPTVSTTAHQTVTVGTASLTLATFAPSVTGGAGLTVVPGKATLSTTGFAPTVSTTQHKTVIPAAASLSTVAFAPTVTASNHRTVTVGTASLMLATFAPTASVSDPITVVPAPASLTLTTYIPAVSTGPALVTGGLAPSGSASASTPSSTARHDYLSVIATPLDPE